jgi:parvulin-like peptidyl-prolyl isomerase
MILKIVNTMILFVFLFTFLSILTYSQTNDERTLASVGDHKITLSDYSKRYNDYLLSTGAKDNIVVRKAILDNMINEIMLYYYDTDDDILNDPKYLKELEATRVQIVLAYLKDQEIYAKITVSEEEMREAFSRVNEQIAAKHLFAKTEEEANNLYELAKIGVDFNTLAKQVFTDSVLQNNGGYLGYFTWGDMDPAFEDAAYSLKVGEISPPIKTAYGYSIIKVEDKTVNPLLTESEFQRKKSHLQDVIKMRKKEPSEQEYLDNIFNESELIFNDETLEKILNDLVSEKIFEAPEQSNQNNECAKYKDKVYNQVEIEQRISELPSYQLSRINSIESLKSAIEGLLLKETLCNIAESKGYDTTKVVEDKFEKYKMSLFLKYKKEKIVSSAELPDSIVFKYYKDNISLFSTEPKLNLQEILVDNSQLADSILTLLNEGIDFGELAKKYSLRKWSAENDGIMGFAPISKFGNYKDLFWNSQVGQIIGPITIENIYGIFRLLGKEESKPVDFDLVKSQVIKASQFENQSEILYDYIEEFRNKVKIRINEDLLYSNEIVGLNN